MAKNNTNNRNPKGRNNSKTRGKNGKKDAKLEKQAFDGTERHNDPNWYFLEPAIADQAASISFASYLGVGTPSTMNLITNDYEVMAEVPAQFFIPSIMEIRCNPCPGDTSDTKSGINIAALKLYSDLSAMNAKTTNYAPQDLTMLLLALGEIISVMEHIRRAFGVAFTYSVRNRDLPVKLLEHMGFDETFLDSIADNRLQFNSLITAINKIPFVSNIAYFYKCADMYQRVYLDSDSPMAQVMFMRPDSTWELVEDELDTGSYLKTIELPKFEGSDGTAPTFANWISIAQSMIDKLFQSATFNYIYSDIINFASKTGAKLLYLDYLMEGYTVVPEYNANFSMQVHNSTIVGRPRYDGDPEGSIGTELDPSFTKYNDVIPDVNKNKVHYKPVFVRTGTINGSFLDMPTPTPTTADKIEATRFISCLDFYSTYSAGSTNGFLFTPHAFPDHYITVIHVEGTNYGGDVDQTVIPYGMTTTQFENILSVASKLYPFRSAPIFYGYDPNWVEEDEQVYPHVFGELNYFTTLPKQWLDRVNDLAFQALFTLR